MKVKSLKTKILMVLGLAVVAGLFVFAANQRILLKKAHSTFENYYVFRGCVQLLERTDNYGLCKTESGQTIEIVKYQNGWYLAGDLPVCRLGVCL